MQRTFLVLLSLLVFQACRSTKSVDEQLAAGDLEKAEAGHGMGKG